MTVAPYTGAPDWSDLGDVGLEDVSAADISMPRVQIDHGEAQFRDSASGQLLGNDLTVVILGLVKQRIMWDTEVDDGDKPQCKSPDFKLGFPQMRRDIKERKQFPWDKSNFDPKDYPPGEDGLIALPCDACVLKEWGKDRTKPPCSEQYTLPLYYVAPDGSLKPGILSLQRSGIKPARTYISTFATAKQPMFTAYTHITLTAESRGKVIYATPKFRKGDVTASDQWASWRTNYFEVRDWLQSRPQVRDDDDGKPKASGGARPAPASAKTATKLDEGDPWATSAATPDDAQPDDSDLPF
jgi:hypothetical protein